MSIRQATGDDIAAIAQIAETTDLFPGDMTTDMIAPFLDGHDDAVWLVAEGAGALTGFCYAQGEMLAEGTWNMRALAVAPDAHRTGSGQKLTADLESRLAAKGVRIVIVDASSLDGFATARAFYEAAGYVQEARLRDYWADGDDKIIYWKKLT